MQMLGRVLIFFVLAAALVIAVWWWRGDGQPQPVACPAELHEFVRCLRAQMPPAADAAETAVPTPPSDPQRRALERAAHAVYKSALSDAAHCATELPALIAKHYAVRDIHAGPRRYCALWEANRGARPLGWGTLLINREPSRWLSLGAPHPMFDLHTLRQTTALFEELDALSLVIAGSHRHALPAQANCTGWPYPPSDATHQPTGYFSLARAFATTARSRQQPWWYLEWHGMRTATAGESCYDPRKNKSLDVYLSNGVQGHVDDFTRELAARIQAHHPGWAVATSGGDIACDKNGSANLLGRFLNGADEVVPAQACSAAMWPARQPSGKFVHIEQALCTAKDCSNGERVRQANQWQKAIAQTYDTMSAKDIAGRQ